VIQKYNGTMTLDDLRNYEVKSREVVKMNYRGVELHGIGAPAGGAVSLNILKIMEQYDVADWDRDSHLTMHRFDEAMRFAYSARLELGDPDFVTDMSSFEAKMVSEENAREIYRRIMDNQTMPVDSYDPKGMYTSDSHGTSHIVTADASGMATSLTTTVNILFGACIMDNVTGVIMYVPQHAPPSNCNC
jgi:gamma-glutamyltranspeptidase/glutathione hydrolase